MGLLRKKATKDWPVFHGLESEVQPYGNKTELWNELIQAEREPYDISVPLVAEPSNIVLKRISNSPVELVNFLGAERLPNPFKFESQRDLLTRLHTRSKKLAFMNFICAAITALPDVCFALETVPVDTFSICINMFFGVLSCIFFGSFISDTLLMNILKLKLLFNADDNRDIAGVLSALQNSEKLNCLRIFPGVVTKFDLAYFGELAEEVAVCDKGNPHK